MDKEQVLLNEDGYHFQEHQLAISILYDKGRPFMLLKPKVFRDGNQWCALYGDNLQEGVAGFGDSPELAAWNFDKVWCEKINK